MSSDENSATDLQATRMEVSIYPAIDRHGSGRPDIDDEQLERVRELLTEHGFFIAPDSYEATLLTTAFVTTEENMKKIDQIVEILKDWYTSGVVSYNDSARPQQQNTSEIFNSVVKVSVQDRGE